MFPIRDHNPSSGRAFVTWALIAVNVAVFLSYWSVMSDPRALSVVWAHWALIPAAPQPVAFVSHMFLHGGVLHLLGNMLFLWVFGDNLEDEMGHLGFLGFYLACGIGAGALQVATDPGSYVPLVGASGAIAGVMGGYLLLFPRARVDVVLILIVFFKVIPVPAWAMLGVWFAIQLWSGSQSVAGQGGVAYWAHTGGFLVGLVLTLPLFLRLGGPRFWSRTHGRPPHPAASVPTRASRIPVVPRR